MQAVAEHMFCSEAALSENPITRFLKTEKNGFNVFFLFDLFNRSGSREISLKYYVKNGKVLGSVADPGCLFRIPELNFSIPDPGGPKTDGSGSATLPRTKHFCLHVEFYLVTQSL